MGNALAESDISNRIIMCKIFFILLLAATFSARADEKFAVLKAGNETFTNVNVTKVSATDVFFTHAGGMMNVKIQKLSPELQKHFQFDPEKAKAEELKRAENKAKFSEQARQKPVAKAPDMTRQPADAPSTSAAVWRTDYPGALKQAKSEGKLVLVDFTGSDWCGWCIKFDKDVLSTSKFANYAAKKLQLVKLDFPHHASQPEELKRANAALSKQFKVDGFPTFVLVNGEGRELWRQVGYLKGGPEAFIVELEKFSAK
jgi:thiol-disulfide isomerase/thioredoxin